MFADELEQLWWLRTVIGFLGFEVSLFFFCVLELYVFLCMRLIFGSFVPEKVSGVQRFGRGDRWVHPSQL